MLLKRDDEIQDKLNLIFTDNRKMREAVKKCSLSQLGNGKSRIT
jgi:hypothetical protein